MGIYLLVDFGSTYTKIIAVDIEKEIILGRAQSPTTINTDITIGLDNALAALVKNCGIDTDKIQGKYASSSAAGGLKMTAIGLVPELTLEAARRAALGAGAKVVSGYGFEIDEDIIKEIEAEKCDIVLLCGGTDGGDKKVIIHNAKMLADSKIDCPILVAGNRAATNKIKTILEEKNKTVYTAKNVLPSLDVIDIEPAQALIREIFIDHIVKAKGLAKAQASIGRNIVPTPMASLQAAALLADGTEDEPGIGSLVIVEIGGATTNIHSVADITSVTPQTLIKGLPELRVKRTVEGDLGIRYNAQTIYDMVGEDKIEAILQSLLISQAGEKTDIKRYVNKIAENVDYVPSCDIEFNLDISLAKAATEIAVERHAGVLKKEYSIQGETMVQYGKNLLNVENIIGTGGVFKYGLRPERILQSGLFSQDKPWNLKPQKPQAYIDNDYMLYGIGLLANDFPAQALRIAKKYLRPTTL